MIPPDQIRIGMKVEEETRRILAKTTYSFLILGVVLFEVVVGLTLLGDVLLEKYGFFLDVHRLVDSTDF
jgi:ABC-type dipeptide/oligopeptide/nickel transport system permease subunit